MSHRVETLATKVCAEYDADLLFYFGPINRPKDDFLIDECPKKKKHKNLVFVLGTYGGDANAGYRIMRTLQRVYSSGAAPGKVYAYVNSVCASAGTLMLAGADELLLAPHAELGPIDVQLKKQDEIGERTSGLTPLVALENNGLQGADMWAMHFAELRFKRGFSTTAAAKIATEITTGLMGKLYEQIDPIRVAEVNRYLKIASEYGIRISKNLRSGALDRLLREYPSHDFVIDMVEAKELFIKVETPSASLDELGLLLKPEIDKYLFDDSPRVAFFDPPALAPPSQSSPVLPSTTKRPKRHARRSKNSQGSTGNIQQNGSPAKSAKPVAAVQRS